MSGLDPDEMGTLTDAVSASTDALKARVPVEGTYLPLLLVEAQVELAKLPDHEVTKRLASLIPHIALRRGLGMTPRKLLAELLESATSDEVWFEKVGPEIRKVLADRGYVYEPPVPPVVSVACEKCGRETTGDYRWDWPERRMVVCSVCASLGQPAVAPVKS